MNNRMKNAQDTREKSWLLYSPQTPESPTLIHNKVLRKNTPHEDTKGAKVPKVEAMRSITSLAAGCKPPRNLADSIPERDDGLGWHITGHHFIMPHIYGRCIRKQEWGNGFGIPESYSPVWGGIQCCSPQKSHGAGLVRKNFYRSAPMKEAR